MRTFRACSIAVTGDTSLDLRDSWFQELAIPRLLQDSPIRVPTASKKFSARNARRDAAQDRLPCYESRLRFRLPQTATTISLKYLNICKPPTRLSCISTENVTVLFSDRRSFGAKVLVILALLGHIIITSERHLSLYTSPACPASNAWYSKQAP